MKQRGFATIMLVVWMALVVLVGVEAYFLATRPADSTNFGDNKYGEPDGGPDRVACTMEAMICSDGSAVGRTGPNCEFAKCPTNYDNPDPGPNPDRDPVGRACSGENDNSCGVGYDCMSRCGPPVTREYDPHPGYYCQPEGYVAICPICLAGNTLIDTPDGQVGVENLKVGMSVWTINKNGKRVVGIIEKAGRTRVPNTHKVVHLILSDGRELLVSPGHPTTDYSRTVGELAVGSLYDGANVLSNNLIIYTQGYTYDILPSGETGFYFANGILLASTLR